MYQTEQHRYHYQPRNRKRKPSWSLPSRLITNRSIFLLAVVICAASIWLSLQTQQWHWFARSGCVLVVLGILLTSNQIIENSKRLKQRRTTNHFRFNHDYAEEYRHHKLEYSSLLEENIWQNGLHGLYLLIIGTLIWGFGDLLVLFV